MNSSGDSSRPKQNATVAAPREFRSLADALQSKLVFVSGKGGVGKTAVSQALALAYSRNGKRTLWVSFEDPTRPPGERRTISSGLDHLNADAFKAFEEYAGLKIGAPTLTHLFLNNKLVRYLAKAAPGVPELVLLGKVWHERKSYDHVVVDMPSTGHGVAMFHSVTNFARLFQGGPLNRDAEAMLESFRDPAVSAQLIVGLPEEMPLRESLELADFLLKLFPRNPAAFLINKKFPHVPDVAGVTIDEDPDRWPSPVATSALDYVRKRSHLEDYNLRIWRDVGIPVVTLPHFRPDSLERISEILSPIAARRAS